MPVGPGGLGVDHPGERAGDPVEALVIRGEDAIQRLPARQVAASKRTPELGVAADRSEALHQRGIEPAAASPRGDGPRGRDAARRMEDLHRLREAQDPPEQGDLVAPQRAWLTARRPSARRACGSPRPSPSAGPACGRCPRRGRSAHRISARVTSPSRLIASSRSPRARGEPPGATVRRDQTKAGPLPRPVDPLRRALSHVVVGSEQRRHPRRVRRAAGVLEQQCVEQVRARRRIQPQRLGEPHADLASP